MKKLLIASLVLVMSSAAAVYAADSQPTTYTERFIQKHTQKIVDKEKQMQEQQKAREDARLKQRKELQKKMEADRKAREDAANARKQKIERKKQLFNELISK
ncbi:unknown [Fusobacterium sp. CAG:439]|nr:unknown [Fusobacterium sp. CAG:439]